MVEARQYQNGSERGSRFMLDSQRSHCHDKKKLGVVDSSEGVERSEANSFRMFGPELIRINSLIKTARSFFFCGVSREILRT